MQKVDRRGVSPEDDGDYAKLRELPMVTRAANDHSDDNTSEDTKASAIKFSRNFNSVKCEWYCSIVKIRWESIYVIDISEH